MTLFSKFTKGLYRNSKILLFGGTLAVGASYSFLHKKSFCDHSSNFPTFSYEEVKRHSSTTGDLLWTIYRDGVYDITEFVELHPGGKIILKAAGAYLDPYFEVYNFHKSPEIMEFLEPLRIGSVSPSETFEMMKEKIVLDADTAFSAEPERSIQLIVRSSRPFNSETPLKYLGEYYTDKEILFVRNHLPVPYIKEDHILEVCLGKKFTKNNTNTNLYEKNSNGVECLCKAISLEELLEKPQHTVDSVIQCTGNRRAEFNDLEPVKGLSWTGGAIGNCLWTGVKLRDILFEIEEFNVDKDDWIVADGHVRLQGTDYDADSDVNYETSISLGKALDPDTVIAHTMNGEPLTRDHGYPLRAIVPGVCGARNVKWLKNITVAESESNSRWQKEDYKLLPSSIKFGEAVDMNKYAAIQNMPINSMICQPEKNSFVSRSVLKDEKGTKLLKVSGYSYSGNGSAISNVQVSVNDGKDWIDAEILNKCKNVNRCWSWTLWTAYVPVKDDVQNLKISARASDVCNNVQPEKMNDIWNMRGLLNNSYNKCEITIS